MEEELNLIVAANERYMPGALVALASVAVNARPETRLRCHVFTEDVKARTFEFLERTLKRLHDRVVIVQHVCDESILAGLPFWAGSRIAAARCLYANVLPDVDWCLYLDCDVLYFASPEAHFSLKDASVYAVVTQEQDEYTRRTQLNWISSAVGISVPESEYFNSGVMLFNLKKMRQDGVPGKLLNFFKAHPEIPSPDQDALNVIFSGAIRMIDPKWNWLQIFLDDVTLSKRPVVHYVSGIPWLTKLSVVANGRFRLWHAFADKYIWQKEGESLRRLMPRRIYALKRLEYFILKSSFLCPAFFLALRIIGKGRYLMGWRKISVDFDVSEMAIKETLEKC